MYVDKNVTAISIIDDKSNPSYKSKNNNSLKKYKKFGIGAHKSVSVSNFWYFF